MSIFVNGKPVSMEGKVVALSACLENAGFFPARVIVSVNGFFLGPEEVRAAKVKNGDRVDARYCACPRGRAQGLSGLIGNTPVALLGALCPKGSARLLAKLEMFNPGGSVKDRIAWAMIADAERKGLLKKGFLVVEPTSGNTGIGLAMICAARGYRCVLTMPDSMSIERIRILRAYGAELVLTPAAEGMAGAITKARDIQASEKNVFLPLQFENPVNPWIHRITTAREILEACGRINAFVVGVGTGGTLTGVGEVLKKEFPDVKIVAVEPAGSPVLSGGVRGSHKIQGIGAGFVPKVLNTGIIDEIAQVSDDDAFACARDLATREGLFVGISSGAACFAAIRVARKLGEGKTIVTLFPDTGERYLSVPGFLT